MNIPFSFTRTNLFKLGLAAFTLGCVDVEITQAVGTNRIFAVQYRGYSGGFQLFHNLRADSSTASSGPLYSPAGGVYGADFDGETLYGVELDNGFVNNYLVVIPHEGALFGYGYRVAPANPIGFDNVEGLAVAGGIIYATSLDFNPPHHTKLITIGTNGVGSLVGMTGTDIMLVGLAYDPVNDVMYGAGIKYATTNEANLYQIDRSTGAATSIGPFDASGNLEMQSLSWDVDLGLIGSFDKLYQINPQTGLATQIGTSDFTEGTQGNGIYALAAYVPPLAPPFSLRTIKVANNDVVLSWDSTAGVSYQVESRGSVTTGTWTNLSGSIVADGSTTSYTNTGGGASAMQLFRVKTPPSP